MTVSDKNRKPADEKPSSRTSFETAKGEEFDSRPKVGLLLGNDVSALQVANTVVKKLVEAGYKPVLFMAEHKPSKKPEAHQLELQNLSFYERYLTNNVLYPLIEEMPMLLDENGKARDDVLYTPAQLAELFDLDIEEVDNINSPEFVQRIFDDKQMPLVVSCRCYQIGHTALIEAQKAKTFQRGDRQLQGAIWNLHPGKLPEYQGLFGPFYAMNDLQRTYKWTLHEMVYDENAPNKGIDAGPIITATSKVIDYTRPAVTLYTGGARAAGADLYNRIEDYFSGTVPMTPQADLIAQGREEKYHSHPDQKFFQLKRGWRGILPRLVKLGETEGFAVSDEIKALIKNGTTSPEIVDPRLMGEHLLESFRPIGHTERRKITRRLTSEVVNWEKNKHHLHANYNPAINRKLGFIDAHIVSGETISRNGNGSNDPAPSADDLINARG